VATLTTGLAHLPIDSESDVFVARREARDLAAELGFDNTDQVRVASAVSDWGRALVSTSVPALIIFELDDAGGSLVVRITVEEPAGFARAGADGFALQSSSRLMDTAEVRDAERTVRLTKRLPPGSRPSEQAVAKLRSRFALPARASMLEDLQAQNAELLRTLEELNAKQDELVRINDELQETNRGVVALYAQLSTELEETNRGVVALYAELDERGAQLRDANNAKSRFLASVSHELRSPLNTVVALTKLLREPDSDPLTSAQDDQLRLIHAAAAQLRDMVDELLDLAKAEAGQLEPHLTEVDLIGLVNDLCTSLRPITPDEIEIVANVPADLPPMRTDPLLLGQVLRNLLSNAVKFTDRGRVTLIVTTPTAGRVSFAVADSGIGIAAEDLELVFEEFFQVPGPLQTRSKGTGLGLPYARRVVEVLGGTLSVSSTPGTGSTFSFALPLSPDTAPAAALEPLPALGSVLVVDDDLGFRHLVRALLDGAAARIIEADGVRAALQRLHESVPDLVLLDLRMPDGSGERVIDAIAEDAALRDVPLVIITSMTPTAQDASWTGRWPMLDKAQLSAGSLNTAIRTAVGSRSV
jgi:signal transduction histidine kinase/CheY-like chemotaxis protein